MVVRKESAALDAMIDERVEYVNKCSTEFPVYFIKFMMILYWKFQSGFPVGVPILTSVYEGQIFDPDLAFQNQNFTDHWNRQVGFGCTAAVFLHVSNTVKQSLTWRVAYT